MGDVVIDGTLTKPEFFRMLSFLGISDAREAEVNTCVLKQCAIGEDNLLITFRIGVEDEEAFLCVWGV